jgi:hypothetical protein
MPGSSRLMPLTANNLRDDCGLETIWGRGMVTALYKVLAEAPARVREPVVSQWLEDTGRGVKRSARGQAREERAVRELVRNLDWKGQGLEPGLLLVALHTYYAIIVKLLAAPLLGFPYPAEAGREDLRDWVRELEGHPLFALAGGKGDGIFSWYLKVWSPPMAQAFLPLVHRLRNYEFSPVPGEDILQQLYHSLLPPALRHSLGEHYTPSWLVQYLYQLLVPRFFPVPDQVEGGLLDPACGSGAFLLPALHALRAEAAVWGMGGPEILAAASRLVVGVDRNPLAVLAARVNYLLALADLLPGRREEFIPPVYLGDTVLAPPEQVEERRFKYIIGNPPWINWETLPKNYRDQTRPYWSGYGLYRHRGYEALLGKSKDDFSILLTYVVLDRYLMEGGTLAFLITQSLFKTTGAGQGFRTFALPGGTPVQVVQVEDLSEIKPFPGARNRTALMVLGKGRPTHYPVPYIYWKIRAKEARPREESALAAVKRSTHRIRLVARPVNPQDSTSPWVTASPQALSALDKIIGPSYYRAREGVNTGGANGVYYLQIQGSTGIDGRVLVANITAGAKRPVPKVEACLEGELIYPLLRGRDIVKWHGEPGAYILLTHREGEKLQAIPEVEMALNYPNTAQYLRQFAPILKERRTRVVQNLMAKGPYYSIFGIGNYTFAPYKVVWLRIGTKITAAVVSRKKGGAFTRELIIPNDSTVFVPFDREEEAHYFCALLSSTPAQYVTRTTSVLSTGSFASPHILEKVAIPQFEPANSLHRKLADLAREAAVVARRQGETGSLEDRIDAGAADLWHLTPGELAQMKADLLQLSVNS